MLTRLIVRNFKRFDEVEIELGNPVVLIGPNNSGKTTVLQALALWSIGLNRWNAERGGKQAPEKRPGVTINRRDLITVPVPTANLLWRNLHVRDVRRVKGKQETRNVSVEIVVEGVTEGQLWRCGLEFDYANPESFYCRLLLQSDGVRMPIPAVLSPHKNLGRKKKDGNESSVLQRNAQMRIAFLPPMSGLAATEPKWEPGRINVLIGEGQTAQVLRNLCYLIRESEGEGWSRSTEHILSLFGVELDEPVFVAERGEITMTYRERNIQLDLSAAGRGLHQTLLLLAHLYANPGSILLLDEPDAHLEILRQQQIYQLLTDTARQVGSQIIAASHSEVVLNEAAGRDVVVAFVGRKPHRIDNRGAQVLKALREIGFDQYYQAEQRGWVLYLEGSTDLAILRAFARRLNHPAREHLERPFVHYVGNQPKKAHDHFFGLREAKADLVGMAVYDRLEESKLQQMPGLRVVMWQRREIENYLCYPEVLLTYASDSPKEEFPPPFLNWHDTEASKRRSIMEKCIEGRVPPEALGDRNDSWWSDVKAGGDEFLARVFERFFKELGLPNRMSKSDYHILAELVPVDLIVPEVIEKLDTIAEVAETAHPREE